MPGNSNTGLQRARYELIANLHDGDVYHPTLIEKWREARLRHPGAGFVFNQYRHLDMKGNVLAVVNKFPELMTGRAFLEYCFRGRHLGNPVWGTVMGRRSIYQRLGWFDESYSFWSDFDMWFRIAAEYEIAFVDEPLIDLPSKEIMPHLFRLHAFEAHRQMFRAFWNARRRHEQGRWDLARGFRSKLITSQFRAQADSLSALQNGDAVGDC